jgi:hypothetical protein
MGMWKRKVNRGQKTNKVKPRNFDGVIHSLLLILWSAPKRRRLRMGAKHGLRRLYPAQVRIKKVSFLPFVKRLRKGMHV